MAKKNVSVAQERIGRKLVNLGLYKSLEPLILLRFLIPSS